jgi:hypothetical protein
MATVTVEATWRLNRVEINTPSGLPGVVSGYPELLLEDAGKAFGSMPQPAVSRVFDSVLDDTVMVDGVEVSFETVTVALEQFIRKWQVENETNPPPPIAKAAELTPVPPQPKLGDKPFGPPKR